MYNLVGNLHDLFCRGTKDYKTALFNVLAYNSSRAVASQASIPDINGEFKNQRCYFDIINAIMKDIEMFNYFSQVLEEYQNGQMQARDKWLSQQVLKKGFANDQNQAFSYIITKKIRKSSEIMSNFAIQKVARSFTDIEKSIRENGAERDWKKLQGLQIKEIDKLKEPWT